MRGIRCLASLGLQGLGVNPALAEAVLAKRSVEIGRAVAKAAEQAWGVLALGLAERDWLDSFKDFFRDTDTKQLRKFILSIGDALADISSEEKGAFRRACREELKKAKQAKLLSIETTVTKNELLRWKRCTDAAGFAADARTAVEEVGKELSDKGFKRLGRLAAIRPW